jgi:hypothetical protein
MKPMIWHPEDKDVAVNQYLEQLNHAPYAMIIALLLVLFSGFTLLVLLGIF